MRNCCWRRFPPSRIEDISWSSTWLYASNLRCIPPGSTSSESLIFFLCVWYSTLGFMYNIVFVIILFCFLFLFKREKTKDYKISAVSLLFSCCYFCLFSYCKDIRRNNQFLPSMSQSNLFRLSILPHLAQQTKKGLISLFQLSRDTVL